MYLPRIQEQTLCFPSVMRMIILAFNHYKSNYQCFYCTYAFRSIGDKLSCSYIQEYCCIQKQGKSRNFTIELDPNHFLKTCFDYMPTYLNVGNRILLSYLYTCIGIVKSALKCYIDCRQPALSLFQCMSFYATLC